MKTGVARYGATAWMVVNRRGSPKINAGGQYQIFSTKKEARSVAGFKDDVVKVSFDYYWEWLPR